MTIWADISGYAALFGSSDLDGDQIHPGAFAASLAQRPSAAVRMLFQHDPATPIGIWLDLREDGKGLFVRGRLSLETQRGKELAALIRGGAVDGLSIGYRTQKASRRSGGGRVLHAVELWEVSIVTFPMQMGARIAAISTATADAVSNQSGTEVSTLLRRGAVTMTGGGRSLSC